MGFRRSPDTLLTGDPCICTPSTRNYTELMEQQERIQHHESCVVPYRETARGIEFCLVHQGGIERWEFPKTATDSDGVSAEVLLDKAAGSAGLGGHLDGEEPLDAFVAARGNESRSVTAYLMRVTQVDDDWPADASHRRLWCLPEEARARLRRKPFRRFIDLALRAVNPARAMNNGASPANALPRKPR